MMVGKFEALFVLLLISCVAVELAKADSDCNCVEFFQEQLKGPYFAQNVYRVVQDYKDAQAGCQAKDPFFYYDHSGQCHDCKKLCDNPKNIVPCNDLCQPYLIYLNYTAEINRLKQDVKVLRQENARFQHQLYWIGSGMATFVILTLVLSIIQFVYYRDKFEKMRIYCPVGDRREEAVSMSIPTNPQEETCQDGDESTLIENHYT